MISLIVTLIVIGVVLYLIQLIPMDATIKRIVFVLVILLTVLWLLNMLGLFGGLPIHEWRFRER